MATATESALDDYRWEVQPAAAHWVAQAIDRFASSNTAVDRLRKLLRDETGTRLTDWIDYLAFELGDSQLDELAEIGYVAERNGAETIWRHPLGMFPPIFVGIERIGLGIRVDSVDDCLAALPQRLEVPRPEDNAVVGQCGGPFCMASLTTQGDVELCIVERHGHQGMEVPKVTKHQIEAAVRHLAAFRNRERICEHSVDGFRFAAELFTVAAEDLGVAWACNLFFQSEREYWQGRNHAARVQYERQNRLGLGWANHDHHTYRSSRAAFTHLIETLEMMGFHCRERFYAGSEAGWGAQVLEQPECRLVIFADVDLSPEELAGDFAHEPLGAGDWGLGAARETQRPSEAASPQPPASSPRLLGTVGLWCELHGEAFLEAGMHHLECQFDFDAARAQLAAAGIETMAPFTNFPFLRQAFTKGETWHVDSRRIERLLSTGRVSSEQAEKFRSAGALGSHLEILERNDGYKGFNQTGVSDIIARTDPRRAGA